MKTMQKSDEIRKSLIFIKSMADAMSECDDLSAEEIKEELKADGLDLDASVNSLMDFVRTCTMDAKRASLDRAAEARKIMEVKGQNSFGKFLNYSREQLLASIKSLITSSEAATSLAYRELDGKSQEDLVSLLEDLEAAKDLESSEINK
ncbi:MAG: hypothetical protein K4571_20065 [Deltaproteobacteria bacterium]